MTSIIDERLEGEYALRRRHPERDEVYARHLQRGAAMRAAAPCDIDVRYGDGPRATLDIYPGADSRRLLFFVHGGYWRALDKSYVAFIADAYRRRGVTVVMPGYDLVPQVRVGHIVEQIRDAFSFTLEQLSPEEVVVSGHSAGGQLAAILALDQARAGKGPIVGLAGVSGVYDLRPLLRTSINADLALDLDQATEVSPSRRLADLDGNASLPRLLAIVGGNETDGFKDWNSEFEKQWRQHGGQARNITIEGATHFTVLDHLADPDDPACSAILQLFPGL